MANQPIGGLKALFGPYSRDSFDRFGDDLTELILKYLPFKDKARLQTVSKQWQRFIFTKQSMIYFRVHDFDYNYNVDKDLVCAFKGQTRFQKDVDKLENLLKKCSAIRKIDFGYTAVDDGVAEAVVQCCPFLHTISWYMKDMTRHGVTLFAEHFGSRLKSLYMRNSRMYKPTNMTNQILLITSCPNIVSLGLDDMRVIQSKKLKPQLNITELRLYLRLDNEWGFDDEIFDGVVRVIPNLKSLLISLPREKFPPSLDIPKRINLTNLNQLTINGFSLREQLFEDLYKRAPNLTKLTSHAHYEYDDDVLVSVAKLSQLTELSLNAVYDCNVTDYGICYLLDNSPNLKKIDLNYIENISQTSINKLFEFAKQRPKSIIKFYCIWDKKELDLTAIPKNLKMNFDE